MSDDIPCIPPVEFALEFLKDLERRNNIEISDLAETSFVHLLIDLHPGISPTAPSGPESTYYEVETSLAQHFAVMAHGNPDIANVVLEICKSNIWTGQPVPFPFRWACLILLRGGKVWPTPKGRPAGERFGLFWLAVSTTKLLCDAYGRQINVARGDDKLGISASDAVADAISEMGVECRFENVRDWNQHKKHAQSRTKAELLSGILQELALQKIGIIKKKSRQIDGLPSKYAPLLSLGRMTGR